MNILGISYQGIHDSSACLVQDGEVKFAIAEERLTRVKHDSSFPLKSIQACLKFANLTPDQIDYVCIGWPQPYKAYSHEIKSSLSGSLPLDLPGTTLSYLRNKARQGGFKYFKSTFGGIKGEFCYVDHNLSHAISTYAFSGMDEATIVVVDGRGAWETTSIWYGQDGKINHVLTIPWPNSLGLLYAEMTYYLGFKKYSDEWKVMGLAPYGKPGVDLSPFIDFGTSQPYKVSARRLLGNRFDDVSGITEFLGPARQPESTLDERHQDIAYAVQEACEQGMFRVVELAIQKTGCKNVCLAGGVALNSKANGKLLSEGRVEKLFIQPASSDDGVCLGAALYPYLQKDGKVPLTSMRNAYLGSEFSDEEIEKTLKTYKLPYTHLDNPSQTAAQLLSEGKIIGWFQGRMEFGPRALGNRSILSDPRQADMKDRVNSAIKFREIWRPFAPSMLTEAAPDFLACVRDSPFMILTDQVKPEKKTVIPAVTHVDGSTRPQTVERAVNPRYWELIKAFEELTGVPVIMNTSFNLRGEAIVSNPTEAIRTYISSGMDALIIGSYLLIKE